MYISDRHRHYLHHTKDSHAAALLVVAEQLQIVARLLGALPDDALDQHVAITKVAPEEAEHRLLASAPPIPTETVHELQPIQVDVPVQVVAATDSSIDYIKKWYID